LRRQCLLRNRLDAGGTVGQGPAKSITRPLLTGTTGSVPVPVPVAGRHDRLLAECLRIIRNLTNQW